MRNAKMPTEHSITGKPLGRDNLSAACRRGQCGSCTSLNCKCVCAHPTGAGDGAGGKKLRLKPLERAPELKPAGFGAGSYGK